jgi:hypothetical protein
MFKPLAADTKLEAGEAGEPAAGVGEIGHKAAADRIGHIHEHDRRSPAQRASDGRPDHRAAQERNEVPTPHGLPQPGIAQRGSGCPREKGTSSHAVVFS